MTRARENHGELVAEKATKAPSPIREPNEREADAIAAARASQAMRPARVEVKVTPRAADPKLLVTSNPHTDGAGWSAAVKEAFGTSSNAFADAASLRLVNVITPRGDDLPRESAINASLAMMGAIAPRNELEAAMGEQIVAAHVLSMDFLARAQRAELIPKAEAYANMATKLSRTMTAQIESLAKLRSGGQQTIKVIYVDGPAVIGDHAQTVIAGAIPEGGGYSGKTGQPHEAAAAIPLDSAALRSQEPPRTTMPMSSHEGSEAVQSARRQEPRSAPR